MYNNLLINILAFSPLIMFRRIVIKLLYMISFDLENSFNTDAKLLIVKSSMCVK